MSCQLSHIPRWAAALAPCKCKRYKGGSLGISPITQQTRDIDPMLVQCWASVVDDGPTLNQHWVNVSTTCLLASEVADTGLVLKWANVRDIIPALSQHWANLSGICDFTSKRIPWCRLRGTRQLLDRWPSEAKATCGLSGSVQSVVNQCSYSHTQVQRP